MPEGARRQYLAFRLGHRVPPLDWAAIERSQATGSDDSRVQSFTNRHPSDVLTAKIRALRTIYHDAIHAAESEGRSLELGTAHVMMFESQYEVLLPLLDAVVKVQMLQSGQRGPDGRLNER